MTRAFRRLRRCGLRCAGDERGLAAVEFALLLTPLLMFMLGAIELGFMTFSRSRVEGTLREAARMATTGDYTSSGIDDFVKDRLRITPDAEIHIVKKAYDDFDEVGKPEPLTSDVAPQGEYNVGDCFQDLNGNGYWDADAGLDGLGGADDIIYYEVEVKYPPLFSFVATPLGLGEHVTLNANTVIRNEPFANNPNAKPPVVCTH